jgi:Ca2+-binding RTX toxin-like protein
MGITKFIVICVILIVQVASYSGGKANSMIDIFGPTEMSILLIEDNVITCMTSICTGTDNADIIIGSSLSETIYGSNENDNIQGNGGDDVIDGGLGDDTIQGGSALDKLFGQDGNDYLYADSSTSSVSSLNENKSLITSEMSVNLNSSLKAQSVPVIKNNTSLGNGSESVDVFSSIPPDILLSQQSFLDGGTGDDHLHGGSGDDILFGGPGHDFFDCGEGVDQVLDFDLSDDTVSTNCEII